MASTSHWFFLIIECCLVGKRNFRPVSNIKIYYLLHKRPLLYCNMSQLSPGHNHTTYLFMTHLILSVYLRPGFFTILSFGNFMKNLKAGKMKF